MKNDCMCSHKQIVYKNTFVMHPFTPFFVTNLDKINIFSLSLIRKFKQDATRDA
jgi:hypothetical protein